MAGLTVYGRAGCVQCQYTCREAERLGLEVTYVDLDQDIAAAARMINAGYRSLPVVEGAEDTWTGFQPGRIQREAARAKQ
ncbi:glutaredoxin family protein [Pseudomonas sp. GX19020]|uniref:glutaredoxin family protein n=1 Tax=Pseudomonas sp. GX19020 TaxID=2942277 RepID=UPI0020196BD9|nr:glutaredoxin family protein [Pseudomonas sp. GX19020]MCL4065913.1 glutaredoxin family protein [Pseudomonas sp. GX19020]